MNQNQTLDDLFKQLKTRFRDEVLKRKGKSTKPSDPASYGLDTDPNEVVSPDSVQTQKTGTHLLIKFMKFCLFMVIGCLAFANVKPYINIVEWLGSGLANQKLVQGLLNVPILGYMFTTGAVATTFVLGVIIWALLQGNQMLPKLVLNNPESLLVLMSWVSRFKEITLKQSDSVLLRQLKQRFNNIPLEWVERMQNARAIAYVIDGILCFGYYPPIVGGYDRLNVFLAAPSFADVDWFNLVAALATMFGIEVMYEAWKILSIALDIMNESLVHQTKTV